MRAQYLWVGLASACGGGDLCGEITSDAAWGAGTHLVSCDVVVRGAQVSAEPGAEIVFASGTSLEVVDGGSFDAAGQDGAPVVLRGETASPSAWGGVFFRAGTTGELAGTEIHHAGGAHGADRAGALHVDAAQVVAGGLTIRENGGAGVVLSGGGGFAPASSGLTVTANGAAVDAEGIGAGTLPADAALSGNLADVIAVHGTVDGDSTWRALGLPYAVTGDLAVEGADTPVLTLSPGVRLAFAGAALTVGDGAAGALSAVGTADERVVFTGDPETAGAWGGITLAAGAAGPQTKLRFVDVGYAEVGITVVGTNPTIDEALVHDTTGCGIAVEAGATPTLGSVTYTNNGGGGLCD